MIFWTVSSGCLAESEIPNRGKKSAACWPQARRPWRGWSWKADVGAQSPPQQISKPFPGCSSLPYPEIRQELRPFEHKLPALVAWPCKTSCTFLHHNPVSGDWLYCRRARGPKFASVTTFLWGSRLSHSLKLTQLVSVRSQTGTPSLWRGRDWMPRCSPHCLPALEGFQT